MITVIILTFRVISMAINAGIKIYLSAFTERNILFCITCTKICIMFYYCYYYFLYYILYISLSMITLHIYNISKIQVL